MATKKKKEVLPNADEVADQLEIVRTAIAEKKLIERKLTAQLLEMLREIPDHKAGNYHITKADTFKVAVQELALPFALQRGLVTISTAKVHKTWQLDENLRFQDPATYGFEVVTQEKVSPIKGARDDE